MRLPITEHTDRPWLVHTLCDGFVVEDVWALPVTGRAEDFDTLIGLMTRGDPSRAEDENPTFLDSPLARALWRLRDSAGSVFRLGRIITDADGAPEGSGPQSPAEPSLSCSLSPDLRATAREWTFTSVPMTTLFKLDREFASELINKTVHSVMHLSWIPCSNGCYRGQMAVLVRPRGRLGAAYMAVIKPLRHTVVYPALLRYLQRTWLELHRSDSAAVDSATSNR